MHLTVQGEGHYSGHGKERGGGGHWDVGGGEEAVANWTKHNEIPTAVKIMAVYLTVQGDSRYSGHGRERGGKGERGSGGEEEAI